MKKTYIAIILLYVAGAIGAGAFIALRWHPVQNVIAPDEEAALKAEENERTSPALAERESLASVISEAVTEAVSQHFDSSDSVQPEAIEQPETASAELTLQHPPAESEDTQTRNAVAQDASVQLPYKTREFSSWQGTWGRVAVTPSGSLHLSATAETAGAEALLLKTDDWSDYQYIANVTVSNGDITLMSRYVDANNFVACNFRRNEVAILKRENGETTVLAKTLLSGIPSDPYFAKNTSVSMRVKASTVGCTALGGAGDNLVATINGLFPSGGIGIQTWFHAPGAATLELRDVRIETL